MLYNRGFSGAVCPGLIEAENKYRKIISQSSSFPGQFAPASLKRSLGDPPVGILSRFSGAVCPGLIEASWRMKCPPWHTQFSGAVCPGLIEATRNSTPKQNFFQSFPGQFAPASLKQSDVIKAAKAMGCFPGQFAPASLKLQNVSCPRSRFRGFPGQFAPASLKLADAADNNDSPTGVFRGSLPRPH